MCMNVHVCVCVRARVHVYLVSKCWCFKTAGMFSIVACDAIMRAQWWHVFQCIVPSSCFITKKTISEFPNEYSAVVTKCE